MSTYVYLVYEPSDFTEGRGGNKFSGRAYLDKNKALSDILGQTGIMGRSIELKLFPERKPIVATANDHAVHEIETCD